jgi:hypothetical protein
MGFVSVGCAGGANNPQDTNTGGNAGSLGGKTSEGGSGGNGSSGGSAGKGSAGSGGGGSKAGGSGGGKTGSGGSAGSSGTITLGGPPPDPCNNQFWVDGCILNDSSSACGGVCSSVNACQESATGQKAGADVTFACPSWMLFSDEMEQAAKEDGNDGFHYAVVGHDMDTDGIDGDVKSTCCQCYQLVYDYPAENQANEDASETGPSAIPIPPPLIVQSFNTATNGPDDFDVFMGVGGYGGNNACRPDFSMTSTSGLYQYTKYPDDGSPGGINAAGVFGNGSACKTSQQWVTTESLSSQECQDKVAAACQGTESGSQHMTDETIQSCIKSNQPQTYYHMNWYVHAKKVECPKRLTDVTGCRLAPQGLPAVDPKVKTAADADSSFKEMAGNGKHFSTTTMQDCCKPTCSWKDNVTGKGLEADGDYNSFYSCDQNGSPIYGK